MTTYPPAIVQADTALPELPPSVEALAHAVTVGAQGPLAQAELLVNWFRSGQFRYTLDPPASPPGTDPLVSFLTQTRSGSCEQFAGAFVVLARSLGLPSRVVVGFTAGRYGGPGAVTVRGADAHAWPQVYLGPRAGWVSFEPTPQQPRGEVAPEGVVGPSGVNTTTPTTACGLPDDAPPPTVPLTVPTTVPTPSGSGTFSPSPTADDGLGGGIRLVDVDRCRRRARRRAGAAADPPPSSLVAGRPHAGTAGAPLPGRGRPRVTPGRGRATFVAAHGTLFEDLRPPGRNGSKRGRLPHRRHESALRR